MGKSLNLGLEALSFNTTATGSGEISIDLVDSVIRVNTASEALQADIFEGDKLMQAFENLCSIQDAIKKEGGVSAALEALVGDNFGGRVSVEGVGETLVKWWDAIVRWFTNMWNNIKQFFKELFDRNEHWTRVLAEQQRAFEKKNINNTKFGEIEFEFVDVPAAPTTANAKEFNETVYEATKHKFNKESAIAASKKILLALNASKGLSDGANKMFSDNITLAKKYAADAKAAKADANTIANAQKGIKEEQEKASAYTAAVKKYAKLCNNAASKMVSVLKSAPVVAEKKD